MTTIRTLLMIPVALCLVGKILSHDNAGKMEILINCDKTLPKLSIYKEIAYAPFILTASKTANLSIKIPLDSETSKNTVRYAELYLKRGGKPATKRISASQ